MTQHGNRGDTREYTGRDSFSRLAALRVTFSKWKTIFAYVIGSLGTKFQVSIAFHLLWHWKIDRLAHAYTIKHSNTYLLLRASRWFDKELLAKWNSTMWNKSLLSAAPLKILYSGWVLWTVPAAISVIHVCVCSCSSWWFVMYNQPGGMILH